MELPEYVKDEFGDFYQDMFRSQVKKENHRAVFLEYAWDMNGCDPCAADPLSDQELEELGVFWLNKQAKTTGKPNIGITQPQAKEVFVTRLHVRYDQEYFPEDLFFQQTADRQNFQGRYVIRHPWKGDANCSAAEEYVKTILPKRQQQAVKTLATLTGRDINDIRSKIPGMKKFEPEQKTPWWKKLWND